jgi:hypothetical protein
MRGAVFRRHQRQVQQFAARQLGADPQARARALFGVDLFLRDGDQLVERLARLGDDQRGHQLGDRGNRQHRVVVLGQQHLLGVLVHHQRHAGLQIERIIGTVEAVELTERGFGGNEDRRTRLDRNRLARPWTGLGLGLADAEGLLLDRHLRLGLGLRLVQRAASVTQRQRQTQSHQPHPTHPPLLRSCSSQV